MTVSTRVGKPIELKENDDLKGLIGSELEKLDSFKNEEDTESFLDGASLYAVKIDLSGSVRADDEKDYYIIGSIFAAMCEDEDKALIFLPKGFETSGFKAFSDGEETKVLVNAFDVGEKAFTCEEYDVYAGNYSNEMTGHITLVIGKTEGGTRAYGTDIEFYPVASK